MSVDCADEMPKPSSCEIGSWLTTRRFALLLLVFVVVMFPDVIFGTRTFFFRDFSVFGYPLAHYLRESFWRGEIPLWNPLNNGGVPFLAQWNTLALYPPSLFFILLPLSWSLGVFCIGHLYLGGLGMYLLAHRWTGNRLAAAVAGFIYAFNGFSWFALVWPQISAGLAWAPFVLLFVERAAEQGGRRIIYAALIGALQMLTGAVELILFTWAIAGALLLLRAIRFRPFGFQWRQVVRFSAVPLLVAALSSAQLLPFFDLAAHSNRDSAYVNERWPMPVTGWANFLLPLFRTFKSFHDVHVQENQSWACSYYLGIATVALALLAFSRRDRRVWILWAIAVLACLFAVGSRSVLYQAVREIFPAIASMRYPVKFVMLVVLVAPLLAALGLAQLLEQRQKRLPRVLLVIGAVLAVGVAALAWYGFKHPLPGDGVDGPIISNALTRIVLLGAAVVVAMSLLRASDTRREIIFTTLLLALLWLDNRTHVPRLNPTVARSVYEAGMVRQYLKLADVPVHGRGRIMPSYDAMLELQHRLISNAQDEIIGRRMTMSGNLNLLDGFSKTEGFFALYPRETWEFNQLLYSEAQRTLTPLKDFFGASYINSSNALMDWTRRESAMPMVTSGQQPIFAGRADTVAALQLASFNPRQVVYLPPQAAAMVGANFGNARIVAQKFAAHRAEIEVEANVPSLVVIAQSYFHRWRASIDGTSVPLLRANHAFQAVLVPTGKHQIVLTYHDPLFRLGALISICTLIGCAGALIWAQVRSRRTTFQSRSSE